MTTAWTLTRTSGPTERAVSLDQAKLNLRLASVAMPLDPEILDAIDAATEQWEQDTDSPAIAATYVHSRFAFPSFGMPIQLSKRPIQSITSVTYVDDDGGEQTVDPATYALDQGRRQVYRTDGERWPTGTLHNEAVKVTYVAGFTDSASCPRYVKRAILLQVHKWFVDPAMEFNSLINQDEAYERLVRKHLATFHAS